MKINAYIYNPSLGSIEEILEVPDNYSEEEIDDEVFNWVSGYFEWSWYYVENEE